VSQSGSSVMQATECVSYVRTNSAATDNVLIDPH